MDDTGQAQDKAREVAGQAQERAQDAAHQAKGRLRGQVDQRSTQAGEQLSSTADDVRSVAEEFRTQGKDTPARYAEQAADKAQQLGQRLQDASGDELLRDVEDFARRNPWAVAAAGLAVGFAASRMLKASSGERYRTSVQNGGGVSPRTPSLSAEPMPSGAPTRGARFERDERDVRSGDFGGGELPSSREPGSMVSTEPRT